MIYGSVDFGPWSAEAAQPGMVNIASVVGVGADDCTDACGVADAAAGQYREPEGPEHPRWRRVATNEVRGGDRFDVWGEVAIATLSPDVGGQLAEAVAFRGTGLTDEDTRPSSEAVSCCCSNETARRRFAGL